MFKVYKDLRLPPSQLEAMLNTRTGLIVGKDLAERFSWNVGDRIPVGTFLWTQKSGSSDWSFDLVGYWRRYPDSGGSNSRPLLPPFQHTGRNPG